jgi:mRNA interferase HigB
LRRFIETCAGRKDRAALNAALNAWYDEARRARWSNTAELKKQYRTASIVSAERVVFNIRGNRYRLVVAVDFEKAIVWIKWIGPHAAYDRIDAETVEYEKP